MLTTTIALLWTMVLAQQVAAVPPGVFVGASDIEATLRASTEKNLLDSKMTEAAIRGGILRVGIIHRINMEQSALVHEELTEIYQIISGSGTIMTGGVLNNRTPVSDPRNLGTSPTWGGIQSGGVTMKLAPKDVIVVPAGTPHKFVQLDGPIDYVIYRFDATPVR